MKAKLIKQYRAKSQMLVFCVFLLLFVNNLFAAYSTSTLVSQSDYPSTFAENTLKIALRTDSFTASIGVQKAFSIVIPDGTIYVGAQILSNTMQFGVRVGNSPETVATGVSPTVIVYNASDPNAQGGAIYVDNTAGTVSFNAVADVSLYVTDATAYAAWRANTTLNPPTAPTGLVASNISQTSVTLSWTDNADNETGYRLKRDGVTIDTLAAGITTKTYTNLTVGTSYTYQVCAYNGDGEACSSTSGVTTTGLQAPTAPNGLVSSNISKTGATLTWQDASDNEDGFKIKRGGAVVGTLNADVTTYTDSSLAAGTTYEYQVCAFNGDGDACSSTIELTTTALQAPTAPSDLGATNLTKTTLTLNWVDNSSNELGFRLYRNNVAIGGDLAIAAITYDDSDLTAGGTYSYKVCAFNNDGETCSLDYDITLPTVQVPIKPSGLTASEFTEDGMKLNWVDNSSNEQGFKLYRNGLLDSTHSVGALSHIDTGLSSGTSYGYVVCAYNDDGEACSNYAWGLTSNLAAPTVLRTLAGSSTKTSLTLEWNDNSNHETKYILKENGIRLNFEYPANETTAVRTNLISGYDYTYQVCAVEVVGVDENESCSDVITDTTLSLEKPINLNALYVTKDAIKLEWTDKTEEELGYKIKRNGIEIWVNGIVQLPDTTATYEDTGLNDNSAFLYQVCAYDDVDESCTELAVSTLKSESPTALWADTTHNTITLHWTDNTDLIDDAEDTRLPHRIKRGSMILVDNITEGTDFKEADAGLEPGTELSYEVCAFSGSEEYCSSTFYAKTAEIVVPTISGFDNADKNIISLTWADNSTIETHFQIKRAGVSDFVNNLSLIDTVVSTEPGGVGLEITFEDSGLEPDTAYVYQVCAIIIVGDAIEKEGCSALYFIAETRALVLPAVPGNILIPGNSATPTSITFEWFQAIGPAGFEVTGYRIEHGSASLPLLDDIELGVLAETSYTDTELVPSTQYEYMICAVNTDGETCGATFVTSTDSLPAVPNGLIISDIEENELVLSWNDNATNETGYQIIHKIVTSGDTTYLEPFLPLGTVTSPVTTLGAFTEYQFKVCSTYEGYASSFNNGLTCSAAVSTTTKPNAPSGLVAASLAQTTVTLNWTNNGISESGYKVKRGGTNIASLGAGTATYTDDAINHSSTYGYEICAYSDGGESCADPFTVETYPAVPVNINITPSQTSVLLTWTDIATNESAYSVKRGGSEIGSLAIDADTYTDSLVTPSTLDHDNTYVYEICAVDDNNATTGIVDPIVKACTNELTVVTLILVPAAPSSLATDGDPMRTSVSLIWNDNSDDEGGFYLYRDGEQVGSVGAGVTVIDDEGLRSGTEYTYKVCAYNSGGEACSAELVLTTDGSKVSMPPIYYLLF